MLRISENEKLFPTASSATSGEASASGLHPALRADGLDEEPEEERTSYWAQRQVYQPPESQLTVLACREYRSLTGPRASAQRRGSLRGEVHSFLTRTAEVECPTEAKLRLVHSSTFTSRRKPQWEVDSGAAMARSQSRDLLLPVQRESAASASPPDAGAPPPELPARSRGAEGVALPDPQPASQLPPTEALQRPRSWARGECSPRKDSRQRLWLEAWKHGFPWQAAAAPADCGAAAGSSAAEGATVHRAVERRLRRCSLPGAPEHAPRRAPNEAGPPRRASSSDRGGAPQSLTAFYQQVRARFPHVAAARAPTGALVRG
jgi:hypothetical protein